KQDGKQLVKDDKGEYKKNTDGYITEDIPGYVKVKTTAEIAAETAGQRAAEVTIQQKMAVGEYEAKVADAMRENNLDVRNQMLAEYALLYQTVLAAQASLANLNADLVAKTRERLIKEGKNAIGVVPGTVLVDQDAGYREAFCGYCGGFTISYNGSKTCEQAAQDKINKKDCTVDGKKVENIDQAIDKKAICKNPDGTLCGFSCYHDDDEAGCHNLSSNVAVVGTKPGLSGETVGSVYINGKWADLENASNNEKTSIINLLRGNHDPRYPFVRNYLENIINPPPAIVPFVNIALGVNNLFASDDQNTSNGGSAKLNLISLTSEEHRQINILKQQKGLEGLTEAEYREIIKYAYAYKKHDQKQKDIVSEYAHANASALAECAVNDLNNCERAMAKANKIIEGKLDDDYKPYLAPSTADALVSLWKVTEQSDNDKAKRKQIYDLAGIKEETQINQFENKYCTTSCTAEEIMAKCGGGCSTFTEALDVVSKYSGVQNPKDLIDTRIKIQNQKAEIAILNAYITQANSPAPNFEPKGQLLEEIEKANLDPVITDVAKSDIKKLWEKVQEYNNCPPSDPCTSKLDYLKENIFPTLRNDKIINDFVASLEKNRVDTIRRQIANSIYQAQTSNPNDKYGKFNVNYSGFAQQNDWTAKIINDAKPASEVIDGEKRTFDTGNKSTIRQYVEDQYLITKSLQTLKDISINYQKTNFNDDAEVERVNQQYDKLKSELIQQLANSALYKSNPQVAIDQFNELIDKNVLTPELAQASQLALSKDVNQVMQALNKISGKEYTSCGDVHLCQNLIYDELLNSNRVGLAKEFIGNVILKDEIDRVSRQIELSMADVGEGTYKMNNRSRIERENPNADSKTVEKLLDDEMKTFYKNLAAQKVMDTAPIKNIQAAIANLITSNQIAPLTPSEFKIAVDLLKDETLTKMKRDPDGYSPLLETVLKRIAMGEKPSDIKEQLRYVYGDKADWGTRIAVAADNTFGGSISSGTLHQKEDIAEFSKLTGIQNELVAGGILMATNLWEAPVKITTNVINTIARRVTETFNSATTLTAVGIKTVGGDNQNSLAKTVLETKGYWIDIPILSRWLTNPVKQMVFGLDGQQVNQLCAARLRIQP
ncbi:hypothetical protein HZB69_04060, partial [Candidatus Amesbacteria bacterium]|nr:hypothetical protein [Candidatus Amesbacteria bacterium]